MKKPSVSFLRLRIAGLVLLAQSASAQGPLAPPGPPAPMMKTLQEMEPRTHIAAAGYTITAPGSYYLTANLNGGGTQNGITVNASGVTIDLRGFSIENCQTGIFAGAGVGTVAVANGTVRDCNATGVDLSAASLCRLEGVILTANAGEGASVGAGSLVTLCTASGNGGRGLVLGNNGTVFRCVVQNNASGGITIGSNCQATENTITGNGSGSGQAGLLTTGTNNRVEGNSANYNNGHGFLINGTGNLVIRNNACSNAIGDYQVASGNNYGQILVAPGAGFTNSNAWANFGCTAQPTGCQTAAQCDDANPCTEDACLANACVNTPIPGCCPDNDADGYTVCDGDCDDANPNINPGAGEVCDDGIDNDCDGLVDEGCGPPVCGNGVVEGGETCDDGNMINGDGCSSSCQNEGGGGCFIDSQCNDANPCTMDLCVGGACQFTTSPDGMACNDGSACTSSDVCVNGTCTGTPVNCDDGDPCTVDTCDGNGGCVLTPIPNCGQACTDGSTQACYTGPAGTSGVGTCQAGTQTCSGGAWGACTGQVLPQTEACDGQDNDCDGMVDEGLGTINCGTGACQNTVSACVNGQEQNCSPGMPSAEICDGIDNDCNGIVDEGGVCTGVCGNGLVEQGETCDDSNTNNGDGCSAFCNTEPGYSCAGSPSVCVAATCSDGIKNGTETGVDCGGGSCAPCANGQGCNAASDCASGVCSGGQCVAN